MFGYVVINKPELKIKDFETYRSFYCGLCRELKSRYGLLGQLALSYDCTFLVMLLTSLYDCKTSEKMSSCIVHPLEKHLESRSIYTEYVAKVSVILAYYKALDDWEDDRKLKNKAYSKTIKKKCRQAETEFPKKAEAIKKNLKKLKAYEKANETDIDLVSGCFGEIMAELFDYGEGTFSGNLRRMGFYLGKFVYILDAYDDLENDLKKGSYNPFLGACEEEGFEGKIKSMLTMMMAECSREFEMLPIVDHTDILRNILYSGVWMKYELKSGGKEAKKKAKVSSPKAQAEGQAKGKTHRGQR